MDGTPHRASRLWVLTWWTISSRNAQRHTQNSNMGQCYHSFLLKSSLICLYCKIYICRFPGCVPHGSIAIDQLQNLTMKWLGSTLDLVHTLYRILHCHNSTYISLLLLRPTLMSWSYWSLQHAVTTYYCIFNIIWDLECTGLVRWTTHTAFNNELCLLIVPH